jgi:hypothetical protein
MSRLLKFIERATTTSHLDIIVKDGSEDWQIVDVRQVAQRENGKRTELETAHGSTVDSHEIAAVVCGTVSGLTILEFITFLSDLLRRSMRHL